MRIAVIGTGRTGSEVINRLPKEQIIGPFNRKTVPSAEKLADANIAIIFVPGEAVAELTPLLLAANIPAIWGSTGHQWPKNMHEQLVYDGVCWVTSPNFSLGMTLIRRALNAFSGASLLQNPQMAIFESHHREKRDQPSGTALKWREWLDGQTIPIHSEREGDQIGTHQLSISTEAEEIEIKHVAKTRALFAEGALWTAKAVLSGHFDKPGLYTFETVIDEVLK